MRSPREVQEASYASHFSLADELDLPIVIHCRDAERRLVEIARETGLPRRGGVIHCFTGNAMRRASSSHSDSAFRFRGSSPSRIPRRFGSGSIVPDDAVMVETDAPYLAPEPYRGKRNEPRT